MPSPGNSIGGARAIFNSAIHPTCAALNSADSSVRCATMQNCKIPEAAEARERREIGEPAKKEAESRHPDRKPVGCIAFLSCISREITDFSNSTAPRFAETVLSNREFQPMALVNYSSRWISRYAGYQMSTSTVCALCIDREVTVI